jgi:hypothetical protein
VEREYASTVVSTMSARNAVEREYASTVVGAESARSAVQSRLLSVRKPLHYYPTGTTGC